MTATPLPRLGALPRSTAGFTPAIPLRTRYDNWIAGEYVRPVLGQYFTNLTPITGEPLCEIARSTHGRANRRWASASRSSARRKSGPPWWVWRAT